MVKLPVIVYNRKTQSDVFADAIGLRHKLEVQAIKDQQTTGRYIRPIVLLQAQPKNSADSTTYQKIKDTLVEAGIPASHIAIKTADKDELKGVDLKSPDCPIRYIITVNALKEGWDCPFAYILATVANRTSSVDVEQILGRVLRLPDTKKNPSNVLNLSYVITCSANFYQTLDKVVAGLNSAGFSSKDYRAKDIEAEVPAEPAEDPGEQMVIQPPVVEVPVVEDEDLPVVDVEDLRVRPAERVPEGLLEHDEEPDRHQMLCRHQQTFLCRRSGQCHAVRGKLLSGHPEDIGLQHLSWCNNRFRVSR